VNTRVLVGSVMGQYLSLCFLRKVGRSIHLHQESNRGTAECGIELTLSLKLTLSSLIAVLVKFVPFQSTSFSVESVVRAEMRSEMLICIVASSERPEPSGSS